MRQDLRQEPYAVVPHVRICAGGGRQLPSLPPPTQFTPFQVSRGRQGRVRVVRLARIRCVVGSRPPKVF